MRGRAGDAPGSTLPALRSWSSTSRPAMCAKSRMQRKCSRPKPGRLRRRQHREAGDRHQHVARVRVALEVDELVDVVALRDAAVGVDRLVEEARRPSPTGAGAGSRPTLAAARSRGRCAAAGPATPRRRPRAPRPAPPPRSARRAPARRGATAAHAAHARARGRPVDLDALGPRVREDARARGVGLAARRSRASTASRRRSSRGCSSPRCTQPSRLCFVTKPDQPSFSAPRADHRGSARSPRPRGSASP